jgi:hypothetical protein
MAMCLIIRILFELHTSQICMMAKIFLHDNIKVYTTMILLVIIMQKYKICMMTKILAFVACQILGTLDPKLKLSAYSILLKF